jgi:hypothetical protein
MLWEACGANSPLLTMTGMQVRGAGNPMLLGRYLGPPIFLDTPGGLGGGGGGGATECQFLPRWSEGRSGSIVRLGRDILCRRVCLLAAEVLAGFALIDPARKQ